MFNDQFQATALLRTVFWTSFSFLTIVANVYKNDSCAECFEANFEQQDSCARSFGQVLNYNKRRHVQVNRWLRRVFTPKFQATRQLRTVFWTNFRFLTIVAIFKQNDSCTECFDANFKQQECCARCFK